MNTRRTNLALLARTGVVLLTAAALAPAATRDLPPSPAIQRKIDGLLKYRIKPEPLPFNPPNPFQLTIGLRRDAGLEDTVARSSGTDAARSAGADATLAERDDRPKENQGPSDSEILYSCLLKLKLGGKIIGANDQLQIVVNGSPRKEGDVIAVDWNNTIIQLRIVRLLPGQMVVKYRDAEMTRSF